MRIKDIDIAAAAPFVRPYLSDAIRAKGSLEREDIRAAVIASRKAGDPVPNLGSNRSLDMLEREIVEL